MIYDKFGNRVEITAAPIEENGMTWIPVRYFDEYAMDDPDTTRHFFDLKATNGLVEIIDAIWTHAPGWGTSK